MVLFVCACVCLFGSLILLSLLIPLFPPASRVTQAQLEILVPLDPPALREREESVVTRERMDCQEAQ